MKLRIRGLALGLALLLIGVLSAAAADQWAAEGSFDKTLKVTGAVDLTVETGSGSIDVRAGEGGTVRVMAKIRARDSRWGGVSGEEKVKRIEANPPIEQNGNVIRIGKMEDRDLQDNVSISYEITVPAETKLRASTGSGSQSIDGVQGPVDANTGSGGIEVNRIQNGLRASTGSGSIRGAGIGGSIRATTGSGSIDLEQSSAGDVEASTGSGGITLSGLKGSLRVGTGSGSIRVQGEQTGDWRLQTASGGITVRLPANAAFELNAHTSSGRVSTAHPVTVQGSMSRGELRGSVRGGGRLLELRTSSGSINIE